MVPGSAPPAWPQHGALQFEDVKMRYRPGLPLVLKGLTFAVPAGTSCGVVGRTGAGRGRARERESERGVKRGAELGTLTCAHARRRAAGAGKSSILNALFRLVELDSGRVLLDGVNTCEGRGGRGGGVRARAGLRFEAASLNSPPPPLGALPRSQGGAVSAALGDGPHPPDPRALHRHDPVSAAAPWGGDVRSWRRPARVPPHACAHRTHASHARATPHPHHPTPHTLPPCSFNLDPFQQRPDADLWAALRRAHLAPAVQASPLGLDMVLSEGGAPLR